MRGMTIVYCVLSVLAAYGLYYVISGLTALKKIRTVESHPPEKRFAVLIPARNEEKTISNLIDSLDRQAYPKQLFDMFVIPNNCTDNTEQTALAAGARIIQIETHVKTKGEVLKKAFSALRYSGYDGYVILDADNLAAPDFLKKMNDALCDGFEVVQGKRKSKNIKRNWVSGCYAIYFGTINTFINRVRMNRGRSANIYGTGFMVSAKAIEKTGFPVETITEDMEYSILCSLKNITVAFLEDAVFFDEQPTLFSVSMKQRERWTVGSYQCLGLYFRRLASAAFKHRNKSAWDLLLFALAPFFQLILTLLAVIVFILAFAGRNELQISSSDICLLSLAILGAAYVVQNIYAAIIVLMLGMKIKDYFLSILAFPIFLMSWIPINMGSLFKKDIEWEPIEHSCDLSICEVDQVQSKYGRM